MNFSPSALWIAGGIAVAAIVCCIALGMALHSEGKIEDRQQADIQALDTVRGADNAAQLINDAAEKKAEKDAQEKSAIIDGTSTDLDGPDLVHGLQYGLRGKNCADGCADPAGKPAAALPGTDDAAGTHANVRH